MNVDAIRRRRMATPARIFSNAVRERDDWKIGCWDWSSSLSKGADSMVYPRMKVEGKVQVVVVLLSV